AGSADFRRRHCSGRSAHRDRRRRARARAGSIRVHPARAARNDRRLRVLAFLRRYLHQPGHGLRQDPGACARHGHGRGTDRSPPMTTKDDEYALLRSAALQNAASIRLARERAEQRQEAYWAEAQRLSRTGSFGWKVATGEIVWSEETFRIFQLDRATQPTVERVLQSVHPQDAAFLKQTIERASQDGKDFEHEFRLAMPDGRVKHVQV